MQSVEVIDSPATAAIAIDPIRSRLLSEMGEPISAASLASRVSLSRQKVNYHLTTLEQHGLVTEASSRRWGGLTERLLVATAATYIVSPAAMGPVEVRPEREKDRLSASYMIALAARVVREVGSLFRGAVKAKQKLATLSVDAEIRFRTAAERASFTHELTSAINSLVARYHDAKAPGGRAHRLIVFAHPIPKTPNAQD